MTRKLNEQERQWGECYGKVQRILKRYGTENAFGKADYLLVDDNYGWRTTEVGVHNLKMIHPQIVANLRKILVPDLNWEISMGVRLSDKRGIWPVMGLTIRAHEIIDGLQRQYFPEPYRSFQYEGSRPGTEFD